MIENAFYVISDKFFVDFPDPFLMDNKSEKRPHYYAMRDNNTGLYWMIPMSSRAEKYQQHIDRMESQGKPCDLFYICKLDNDRINVFLIVDMIPVSEEYIARPYTVESNHLKLTNKKDIKEVRKKAKKILGMKRRGFYNSWNQAKVFDIEKELLKKNS